MGVALWPAAPVLARWGIAHLDLFCGGPAVLKIGCGIGLTGTALGLTAAVAAALAGSALPTLTLTDVNPIVLENLRYNAALNDPASNEEAMPIAAALLRAAAARAGCAAGGEEGASAARAVACDGDPIAQAEHAGGDGGDDRRCAAAPAAGLYRVASHDWSLPLAGGAGAAEACGWGADAGLSHAGRCPCARGARCAGGAFDVILASDAPRILPGAAPAPAGRRGRRAPLW